MSWFAPKKGPKNAREGIRLRRSPATGDTWWSAQWIQALTTIAEPRRLKRGQQYAQAGQVLSVHIENGYAEALVQGSRTHPYKVEIGLPMLTPTQAKRVAEAMLIKALLVAKLLTGELPHDIATIFDKAGVPLFPQSAEDLSSDCSCPDDYAPCKHVAAVYYILGQEFDRDPFMLLEMRGLKRSQLLSEIQFRRVTAKRHIKTKSSLNRAPAFPPQTSLSANLNDFYDVPKGRSLTWQRPTDFLAQLPPAGSRIRELGSPPFWQSDYDFQDILKAIYVVVRKKTLEEESRTP